MMIGVEDIKETLEALLDMVADEVITKKIAVAHQNLFVSLIRHGFTREEAMQILLKMPIGTLQK